MEFHSFGILILRIFIQFARLAGEDLQRFAMELLGHKKKQQFSGVKLIQGTVLWVMFPPSRDLAPCIHPFFLRHGPDMVEFARVVSSTLYKTCTRPRPEDSVCGDFILCSLKG